MKDESGHAGKRAAGKRLPDGEQAVRGKGEGVRGDFNAVSRRDALKTLALGAATVAMPGSAKALPSRDEIPANDAPHAALKFFTPHEYATVHVLVDLIIPRDERSGSATDVGVPAFMDRMLAEEDERTRTEWHGGFAWLDRESNTRFGKTFLAASAAQRTAILDDIAWPARAKPEMAQGVSFFNELRDMTASGFWSTEVGYRDLQYKGNVFAPNWNGCSDEAMRKIGVSYDVMKSRVKPESRT